jgi:hypothetical protein
MDDARVGLDGSRLETHRTLPGLYWHFLQSDFAAKVSLSMPDLWSSIERDVVPYRVHIIGRIDGFCPGIGRFDE